jgi:hypothetical protein
MQPVPPVVAEGEGMHLLWDIRAAMHGHRGAAVTPRPTGVDFDQESSGELTCHFLLLLKSQGHGLKGSPQRIAPCVRENHAVYAAGAPQ